MPVPPFVLIAAAAVVAAACRTPAPPLALPPVAVAVRYAATDLAAAHHAPPQRLGIAVLALRQPPGGAAIEAVAARLTSEHGQPFRAASPLPAGSRWLDGDAAAALWRQQHTAGDADAQVRGTAEAVLSPQWETQLDADGLPALRLRWHDGGGGPRLRLSIDHTDRAGRRSTVDVDDPFGSGAAALFVAGPGSSAAGHAIALSPQGAADPASAAQIAASLTAETDTSASLPAPLRAVLTAVGAHPRRAALLGLARPLGAPRALDLLLIADAPALIAITAGLAADPAAAEAAWPFERAVWLALLPLVERGELSLALQAAFARHLGAIADDPAALRALLAAAGDEASFLAAVRRENEFALADRHAAVRCAGHDWLLRHGCAVADYDPLAAAAARSLALRRHAAASDDAEAGR